jgi:hypothetical protein
VVPRPLERDDIAIDTVDQEPVGREMAFAMAPPFALQGMIIEAISGSLNGVMGGEGRW